MSRFVSIPTSNAGMNFFPQHMMDLYKAITFTGEGKTMMFFSMGIMGVQMFQHAVLLATMRTESASSKAAGVTCLANALFWGFFVLSDGIMLTPLGTLPKWFPKEAIVGNCVLFSIVAGVNLAGWIDAGKPLPELTKGMIPTGVLSKPLIALAFNLSFFAVGCAFFTGPMIDQFLPGVMKKFKPDVVSAIFLIMGNAGKMMLLNIASMMMIVSAEPGDADTNYRVLRSWVYVTFFYMGRFACEEVVSSATGWPSPMRVQSFVSCFAVLFYGATALGDHQITVSKTGRTTKSKSKSK